MPAWTCPKCQRRFGRAKQGHECAPAMTMDEYLASGPPWEPAIVQAVLEHLDSIDEGDLIVDPVSVGVLLKRGRTFAELRPMAKWEAVWFVLPRAVTHPRITRRQAATAAKTAHSVRAVSPGDIDDQVREWLTEAYLDAR